ncbi:hypothetical protein CFC21_077927 [Triticum aestivum]|uniref:Uncharacterized protein n=2 Tax=Triticum aestivum TaxID=4565 RepID=A0A9R1HWJ7_WHEAT|nr:hypothetical protein CFC21_077927 [Triticum aestivum]
MSIRSLIVASRSRYALAASTISQATSRAHQHACVPPLLSGLGPLVRAFSSSAAVADVNSGVRVMEGQLEEYAHFALLASVALADVLFRTTSKCCFNTICV